MNLNVKIFRIKKQNRWTVEVVRIFVIVVLNTEKFYRMNRKNHFELFEFDIRVEQLDLNFIWKDKIHLQNLTIEEEEEEEEEDTKWIRVIYNNNDNSKKKQWEFLFFFQHILFVTASFISKPVVHLK